MAANDITMQLKVQADTRQAELQAEKLARKYQEAVSPKGSIPSGGETKTARSIGAGAGTGSAASDFAAQSRGLGGLVHVYATFAANIYALSAAFTALSKAADTSNLVNGLDQLGVASGRNLGTLAKQMVSVTNNAISMRDSLTSVALASSGGMSNKDILRMTEVAKQASQVLGRDLTDSMDRLTKGIVKNQPELLDELGIMTRMIPAQQAYARSIGKSVDSLTELEKKQAFTNAVLKEGEDKFGKIKAIGNPYGALLAGTQNLLQSGLELINKVLGPIVGLLAESPAALALALGGIASILIKQAVPAITQWREGLRKSADEATELAKRAKTMHEEFQVNKEFENLLFDTKGLKAKATKGVEEIQNLVKSAMPGTSKLITNMLSESWDLSKEAPKYKAAAARMVKELSALETVKGTTTDKTQLDIINKQIASVTDRQKKLEEAHKVSIATLEVQKKLNDEMDKGTEKIGNAKAGYFSIEASLGRIAKSLQQGSTKANILANVGTNTQIMGITSALQYMHYEIKHGSEATAAYFKGDMKKEELEKQKGTLEGLGKATTYASGTFRVLLSALGTVISSMGYVGQAIGIVIGTIEMVDIWFSKADKEAKALASSLEAVTDATKLLKDVNADLLSKDPSKWMSAESMSARATAIQGASDSIELMLKNLDKWDEAANGWDKFWDSFVGKSRTQKAAKSISEDIKQTLKTSNNASKNAELKAGIEGILGKGNTDITKATKEQLVEISKLYKSVASDIVKAANDASAPKNAFLELDKAFQNLSNSLMPTDNMSKFGIEMNKVGASLIAASGSTSSFATELARLVDTPVDLAKLGNIGTITKDLGGEGGSELKKLVSDYSEISRATSFYEENIATLNEEIDKNNKLIAENQKIADKKIQASHGAQSAATMELSLINELNRANEKLEKAKKPYQAGIDANAPIAADVESKLKIFTSKYFDIGMKTLLEGNKILTSSLDNTVAQAAARFSSVIASSIGGPSGSEYATKVALQEMSLRQQGNNIMLQLISTQEKTNIELEIANAEAKRKELIDKESSGKKLSAEENQILKNAETTITRGYSARSLISDKGGVDRTAYEEALNSKDINEKAAATKVQGLYVKGLNVEAQNASIEEEKKSRVLQGNLDTIAKKYEIINRNRQYGVSILEFELSNQKQLADLLISASANESANLTARNIEAQKLLEIENQRAKLAEEHTKKLESASKSKDSVGATEAENKAYADQTTALQQKYTLQLLSNAAAEKARNIADNNKKYEEEVFKLAGDRAKTEQQLASETATTDNAKARLDMLHNIGAVEDKYYITKKAELDLLSMEQATKATLNNIDNKRIDALGQANKKYEDGLILIGQQAGKEDESDARVIALAAQKSELTKRINTEATNGIAIAQGKLATDSEILRVNTEFAKLQAKQNEQMQNMVSITESLTTLFGEMGTNIGKAGEALLKMSQDDQKYVLARNKAEEDYAKAKQAVNDSEDPAGNVSLELLKKQSDARKVLDKLDRDKVKSDLSGVAAVAGATKKMFSEKTAAYKVLDAAEKVSAAIRMGIMAQELAMELAALPTKIAGGISTMFSQSGWGGFAGAAAFLAILGGLGVSSGSITEPKLQKSDLAGTGQELNTDGSIKNTNYGVIGDPKATAKSINDSIDLLGRTFFEYIGDPATAPILNYLKSIRDNTAMFATAFFRSIAGGDTQMPGSFSLGGGSMPGMNSAILGGIGYAAASMAPASLLGGTGFGLLASAGPAALIGVAAGLILDKLGLGTSFSGGEDWKAQGGGGIRAQGTLGQLSQGSGISAYQKYNVDVYDATFFGQRVNTRTNAEEKPVILGSDTTRYLSEVFKDFNKLIVSTGEILGFASSDISKSLENVTISIDTYKKEGMTDKEFTDQLTASISTQINKATVTVFPWIQELALSGEEYGTTIARIVQDSQVATIGLKMLDTSIGTYTKTITESTSTFSDMLASTTTSIVPDIEARIKAEQELIKLYGNSEIFAQTIQKAYDALTPTKDKLEDRATAVKSALSSLGETYKNASLATITSKSQLLSQIQAQDLTTESGKKLFKALTDLAPVFSQWVDDIEKARIATEDLNLAKDALDYSIKSTDNAIKVARDRKLNDPNLSAGDKQILLETYALEDANKLRKKSIELLNAEGKSYQALLLTREDELKNLTLAEQVEQRRIYAAQDRAKLDTLNIKIMELLGDTSSVLAEKRQKELNAMDESLRTTQRYIYALEDEASLRAKMKIAYDKETSALKTTISNTQNFIKSLNDAKDNLLAGADSILTPLEKYALAKSELEKATAAAKYSGTDAASLAARNDALNKLPNLATAFLANSKTLYASSAQYTQDFGTVTDILSTTSNTLTDQQTEAERQLSVLESSEGFLSNISNNTDTFATLLNQYLTLQTTTEAARVAASGTSTAAANAVPKAYSYTSASGEKWAVGTHGKTSSFSNLKSDIISALGDSGMAPYADAKALYDTLVVGQGATSELLAEVLGISKQQVLDWAKFYNFPAFASGGLASGLSIVGEKGPELVDFRTPGRVYSNQASNQLLSNKELIEEIKALKQEVKQLRDDQREQTGHLIASNYDANHAAADKIVAATEQSTIDSNWSQRNSVKVA